MQSCLYIYSLEHFTDVMLTKTSELVIIQGRDIIILYNYKISMDKLGMQVTLHNPKFRSGLGIIQIMSGFSKDIQ